MRAICVDIWICAFLFHLLLLMLLLLHFLTICMYAVTLTLIKHVHKSAPKLSFLPISWIISWGKVTNAHSHTHSRSNKYSTKHCPNSRLTKILWILWKQTRKANSSKLSLHGFFQLCFLFIWKYCRNKQSISSNKQSENKFLDLKCIVMLIYSCYIFHVFACSVISLQTNKIVNISCQLNSSSDDKQSNFNLICFQKHLLKLLAFFFRFYSPFRLYVEKNHRLQSNTFICFYGTNDNNHQCWIYSLCVHCANNECWHQQDR